MNAVLDPETGASLEYCHLMQTCQAPVWSTSFANELGRLVNGVGTRMPTGTNTMGFIPKHQVPHNKNPTHARLVCDIHPHKKETHRTRLTIGGNLIDFPGDKSTSTADITAIKCLLNSTISDPKARFCSMDVKNFYLGTPLETYEYMKIKLAVLPDKIISQYNLHDIADDGWVYCEIKKGMYGLPNAGKIANKRLVRHLAPQGYTPVKHTP